MGYIREIHLITFRVLAKVSTLGADSSGMFAACKAFQIQPILQHRGIYTLISGACWRNWRVHSGLQHHFQHDMQPAGCPIESVKLVGNLAIEPNGDAISVGQCKNVVLCGNLPAEKIPSDAPDYVTNA